MPTGPRDGPVLVIEDHALFAESVAITLRLEGYDVRRPTLHRDLDLVGLAAEIRPRVALVDLDLGEFGDGTGRSGRSPRPRPCRGRDRFGRPRPVGRVPAPRRADRALQERPAGDDDLHRPSTVAGLPVLGRLARDELLDEWRRGRRPTTCCVTGSPG